MQCALLENGWTAYCAGSIGSVFYQKYQIGCLACPYNLVAISDTRWDISQILHWNQSIDCDLCPNLTNPINHHNQLSGFSESFEIRFLSFAATMQDKSIMWSTTETWADKNQEVFRSWLAADIWGVIGEWVRTLQKIHCPLWASGKHNGRLFVSGRCVWSKWRVLHLFFGEKWPAGQLGTAVSLKIGESATATAVICNIWRTIGAAALLGEKLAKCWMSHNLCGCSSFGEGFVASRGRLIGNEIFFY